MSQKLLNRFLKSLQLRIQRPWFQDNFFIKYCELFFVKIVFAKWNSYLYAQCIEFFLLYSIVKLWDHALSRPLVLLTWNNIQALCLIKDYAPAKFDRDRLRNNGEIVGENLL